MPNLFIARDKQRKGLYLPMGGTKDNPSMMFVLNRKLDRSELDELVRAQLAQLGITKESDVQSIISKAESEYEYRVKIEEVKKELKRLMDIRAKGGKLMQVGFRKWKQAFYPGKGGK